MKRKWTLLQKKKLLILLVGIALSGLMGYLETLIPLVFPDLPMLHVHLAMLPALLLVMCYSPAEAAIAWGVRCVVYGLVLDDGYAILFDLVAGIAALCVVWAMLRALRFGGLLHGISAGLTYAIVITALDCIVPRSITPFYFLPYTMAFYFVNYMVLGILAYVMLRYIPHKLLFDDADHSKD